MVGFKPQDMLQVTKSHFRPMTKLLDITQKVPYPRAEVVGGPSETQFNKLQPTASSRHQQAFTDAVTHKTHTKRR